MTAKSAVERSTVIRLEGVEKRYGAPPRGLTDALRLAWRGRLPEVPGRPTVLRDLSLTVRAGESVGVIGVNGAGKTTLLKIIAGLVAPTAGRVEVEGEVTAMFQLDLGFREESSGLENVERGLRLRGCSRAEIDALVPGIRDFAEIGEWFDRPVRTWSLGMRARVAFAAMTARPAGLLLIDEALSVGDARFASRCAARLAELRDKDRTVLTVSHNLGVLEDFCERVIWIDDATIRADGDPGAIIADYKAHCRRLELNELERRRAQAGGEVATLAVEALSADGVAAPVLTALQPATFLVRREQAAEARELEVSLRSQEGFVVFRETGVWPAGHSEVRVYLPELLFGHGKYQLRARCLPTGDDRPPEPTAVTEFEIVHPNDSAFRKVYTPPLRIHHHKSSERA